jgi:hypothetical protein
MGNMEEVKTLWDLGLPLVGVFKDDWKQPKN